MDVDVEEQEPNFIYEPESKKQKPSPVIPLDIKIKVVALAKLHPTWNLKSLQSKGATTLLKRKDMLKRWEKDIEKGGTNRNKYAAINKWTYDRFVEARERAQHVTTTTLQRWAMGAAMQYISGDSDFNFTASLSCVKNFKKKHRIRQRHVTKTFYTRKSQCFNRYLKPLKYFKHKQEP